MNLDDYDRLIIETFIQLLQASDKLPEGYSKYLIKDEDEKFIKREI